MKSPRILVAETEAIVTLDLKFTLEKWGFNVEATFRTGEELLEYAQADDPDILIMDTFLVGKLDGYTTAQEVLKTNKVPVIFMTTESKPEYSDKTSVGGRFEYLKKPFTPEKLKQALKNIRPDLFKN
jgi:DNA-binding response OmpR family regulator